MKLTTSALGVALVLGACAAPAPRPDELLRLGRLDEALAASGNADPATRAALARAQVDRAAPALTLEYVPDSEMVEALGGYQARRLLGAHRLLRLRLATGPGPDRALSVEVTSVEGPSGLVAQVPWKAQELAYVTGERVPQGREWSEWKTVKSPVSDLKVQGPVSLSVFLIGSVIFAPLQLLSLHSESHYVPPSAQAIAAALPRATALVERFAPRDEGGVRVVHLLLRRPVAEPAALLVRVDARVGGGAGSVALRTEVLLAAPPTPPVTVALAAAARQVALRGLGPPEAPCPNAPAGGCPKEPVRPFDALEPIGLEPPPRPATASTPRSSDAARPWWAGQYYAASPDLPRQLPPAGPDEPAALLDCRLEGFGSKAYLKLVDRDGVWDRPGQGRALIPLVNLAPGASTSVEVWEPRFWTPARMVARAQVTWADGAVKGVWKPARGGGPTCTAYGRDALEAEFARRWGWTLDAIEGREQGALRLDLREKDLGALAGSGLLDVRGRVRGLAALAGWDDPRVVALTERVDGLDARVNRTVLETVETWEKGLGKEAEGRAPRLELRPTGVRCDQDVVRTLAATRREALAARPVRRGADEHRACLVAVEVRNPTERAASWKWLAHELRLLLDDGRITEVEFVSGPEGQLAPGATTTVSLAALNLPQPSAAASPWRLLRWTGQQAEILPVPVGSTPQP